MSTTEKINTSNLLNHNEKEELPCKNGYSFRFQGIIDKNIQQLRILNKYNYPQSDWEDTYTDILKRGPHFNYFGVYNDIAVGTVCTKLEDKDTKLVVANIHVLPRYRRLGVGSRLVEKAVEIAKKQNGCKTVSVQVPTADDALLQLFTKCGFEKQQETVKTDTTECFVLVKTL